MNTFLIKNKNILPAGLASAILLLVLFLPTYSHAYWSIEGSATDNTFQIGSLETIVSDNDLNASFSRTSGDTVQFTITDNGTLTGTDTIHKLEATAATCAPAFYQGIDVTLNIDSNTVHDDALDTLDATSTDSGTVELELSTNQSIQAAENETCTVKITLDTYQTHFADNTSGFTDSHTISLTITASEDIGSQPTSSVVLNEIYPSVLATTTVPLEREWVELYNGTGGDIDVNGYAMSEISGSDEVLYEIAATCPNTNTNDYVTPINSTNTVIADGGYIVLEFCGGGSYLNDGGDTVSLYDGNSTSTATQLDTHTYPVTSNGKSHQRIPDGGTWVDPLPTPGMPNDATREDLEAEGWDEEEIVKTLKALDSVKTEVNGANEKDEDNKEKEIDESARNEDEENKEAKNDEEKQKVNEGGDSDKSKQEKDEEEHGDDKNVDEDKSDNRKKEEDSDKSLPNEGDDSGDTDNDEKESGEQENEDETKDSQEKSDHNDENAGVEDKEDKQNSDKDDIDEQQAKDEKQSDDTDGEQTDDKSNNDIN